MKLKHYRSGLSAPGQHRLAAVGILVIASAGMLAATGVPAGASGPPTVTVSHSGDQVTALAENALSLLHSDGNAPSTLT